MLLKKISAAAAGLALMASGPAVAANSASTMLVSAAAVAQDSDADEVTGLESYIPAIVVVVFTVVFVYFLLDSQENDTVKPPAPNPGLPVSP
jgi:hypothetical protein